MTKKQERVLAQIEANDLHLEIDARLRSTNYKTTEL